MFTLYAITCIVLNFTLVPLVWASEKQIDLFSALTLSAVTLCAMATALVQRRLLARGPSKGNDFLSVNLAAVVIVACFCLCGWPEPTRYIATMILASCTIWWWAAGMLRYLNGKQRSV